MIFISELHKKTLLQADELINKGKTFEEIQRYFWDKDYSLRLPMRNGYISKTKICLYKNGEYSFVDIKKRRNGLATWETVKLG